MIREARLRWLAAQFARPSGWAGRWLVGPWLDRIAREMNRLALERLEVGPAHNVLEIGFGGGDLLAAILASTTGEVFGIDVSDAMIERARRRFAGERRLHLFHASAEALPLADAAVDRAVSSNSIYFWPDPDAAIRELARVLRPGGRLVLAFEPPEELARWPGHRFGFRPYGEDELRGRLAAAGFGRFESVAGTGRKPDRFLCLSAERLGANG